MAAGVRVRLYPQFSQIIDANIAATDWTRPLGICPSLNPPAGIYWAYFRGRQGPETPILVTIPPGTPAPELDLSGSLQATLFHGNPPLTASVSESGSLGSMKIAGGGSSPDASLSESGSLSTSYEPGAGFGFLKMLGPTSLDAQPLVFASNDEPGAILQIDISNCQVTVATTLATLGSGNVGGGGTIQALGSLSIESGSKVYIGPLGWDPGWLSNASLSNGFATISNSATILDYANDLWFDGLIDGSGTTVIVSVPSSNPQANQDNSFISWGGGGAGGPFFDVESGSTVEVSHSAFVENGNVIQTSWRQTLTVRNNSALLVSGSSFGSSDNAFIELSGNGDSVVIDHGGVVQVLDAAFMVNGEADNLSANYTAFVTVDGSGSLLRMHDESTINFCNGVDHGSAYHNSGIAVTDGGTYESHGEAALWLSNDGTGTNGGSSNSVNGPGFLNVTADFQHSDGNLWIGGTLTISSNLTLAGFEKIQVNTGNSLPFFTASQGAGHTMNFTSAVVVNSGTVSTYAWNFGDSGTSTSANPSHTYAASGTYRVVLTVTDSLGNVSDVAIQVVVS
ncbi:MAG: PKD domain-containing protein [Patescibacteria group bacterium]|nr:PKD domain-containing protein [Patescibacteria group bacterium]